VSDGVSHAAAVGSGLRGGRSLELARPRALRGGTVACVLGLALLATVMCAAHVRHGGLYYDDWSLAALGRFPGPGGLLHALWLDYGQRPGQVLYYAGLDRAFGTATSPRLALAAAMLVLQSALLYVLLLRLRMRARDAAAIAGLALVFPFRDSVWLWGVLSLTSLAICAALLGLILALRAFERSGPRAPALHVASLGLYAASVLSYEAFAVAGCLAGVLYVRAAGLRRARPRWLLDVGVIVASLAIARIALPVDVATPSRTQSLAGMLHHAGLILSRGARLLGASAIPVADVSPWIGAGALVAVLAAAGAMRVRLPAGEATRTELGRWLAIAAGGALAALAAWAIYLPASDHYAQTLTGTVNRMNAGAGLGIAILVYAWIALAVLMLGRLARLPSSTSTILLALAALVLGAGYLGRSRDDAKAWDAAATDQRAVLAEIRAALPGLPRAATVYLGDAPAVVGPGIPVLNTTLDLTSAMRVAYSSPDVVGVPLNAANDSVACGTQGPLGAGVRGVYGRSYYLAALQRPAILLRAPAQCLAKGRDGHPAGWASGVGR
jgi:hypothetical protein